MKNSISSKKPQVSSTLGLARQLGLSEWTVSRAINGHPEVKAATRERILKAMDEFGFRPSPVARGLSGKDMGIVGICFAMARNALMMEKITILDQFLADHNLRGVLAICPPDEASQIRILHDFKHLRVDGLFLIQSHVRTSELKKALAGIRCVHVDSGASDLCPRVWLDRPMSTRLIMGHLHDLGHRSFATLGFSATLSRPRWQGIVELLAQRGLRAEDCVQSFELPELGLESYAEGIQLSQMVMAARHRPTAILAVNDAVAVGAIQGFRDHGLSVPDDISIVGYGNFEVGRYLRPRLTTIDQRPAPMMQKAGEMLLVQLGLAAGQKDEDCRLEPLLIVGESTGPVARRAGA